MRACRLMVTAALLLGSTGCDWLPFQQALDSLPPLEDVPISFAAPEMITVRPGDTLAKLANRHGTTVKELKSWNGLQSDTIEVDQVLLLWRLPEPKKVAARSKSSPSLQDVMGGREPLPVPPNTPGTPELTPTAPAPVVASGEAPPVAPVPAHEIPAPGPRVAIQTPALLAFLGVKVEDDNLAEATAGLQRHDSSAGNQMELGDRSLGTANDVDNLELERPEMRNLGPQIPDVPVSPPRLSKPAPKACLRGGSTVIGENGVTRSSGLSVSQINAAMGGISRYTVKCFPPGTAGTYEVIVEVVVGCDGRVSNVFLVNGGVVPARVTSCIQQTLGFASFPAHGQPDGATFQYPMKFRF